MNEPVAAALLSPRDRRVLLWLVVGAVCWRWLIAIRAPLPAVSACTDLWVAQQLAHGKLAALHEVAWGPWWALCSAPAVAAHAAWFTAAQALGCVLGGLALWPAAAAAERLRHGAGIPAAVFVLAAAVPVHGAAVGSSMPLGTLAVALAMAAAAGRRWWLAAVAVAIAAGLCADPSPMSAKTTWWQGLRSAWSLALPAALLSLLTPRPRGIAIAWLVALVVFALAWTTGRLVAVLSTCVPLVAVLAGVGLTRLPVRLRDLALAGFVAVEFHAGWHLVEPRGAIAERLLGEHLLHRLDKDRTVVSDLPRVLLFSGQRPAVPSGDEDLLRMASEPEVAFLALGASPVATVTAALAGRFVRYEPPQALRDLVVDRHITVFARRD